MPKVTEAYLDARRQQVLDAAFACFARKGFSETTIKDIAREAGVSYGVVYHYFPSKEDIIVTHSKPTLEARAERFAQAEKKGRTAEVLQEALRLNCGRWAGPEAEPEVRLRVQMVAESLRNPRIAAALDGMRDYRARYRAVIRRGQECGEVNPDLDPEAVAQVLIALQEGILNLKAMDSTVDVSRYLKTVEALLDCRLWADQNQEDGNGDGQEDLHTQAESPLAR